MGKFLSIIVWFSTITLLVVCPNANGLIMETHYLKPTLGGKRGNIQWEKYCRVVSLSYHYIQSIQCSSMQSAILLSFISISSLPPCWLQSTHPRMPGYIIRIPCYISPMPCYISPMTCNISSMTCNISSMPCYISPMPCYFSPMTCNISSMTCNISSMSSYISSSMIPTNNYFNLNNCYFTEK